MGLLETLKENRERSKLHRIERQEKNDIARAKAQAAYDIEFQKGAVNAVKARARREATERFGYSPRERRAKAMGNFAKEMGGLGNIGNMGGSIFGETQKRSSGSHRKKSGSGSHTHIHIHTNSKKHRSSHRQQKEKDPFDFSDLGF